MRKLIIATIICCTVAAPAAAGRFVPVAFERERSHLMLIDIDTIRSVSGFKRAWVLTLMLRGAWGSNGPVGKPVFANSLMEFNCITEQSHILATKIFDEKEKSLADTGATAWDYPAPNAAGHELLEYACGKEANADDIISGSALEMFRWFSAAREKGLLDK